MSFYPQKRHSRAPSTSDPASGFTSSEPSPSQVTHRRETQPSQSPSDLQLSPQENQQSQPVYPWSAHAPPPGQSPSPFLRHAHAYSTSATVAGELFLFGGCAHRPRSPSNDLYVFSTQDFSATLLQTSGDVPSPRYGHRAVLAYTTLLIWGGRTDFSEQGAQNAQNRSDDDSLYLLNLGTSVLYDINLLQLIQVSCVPVSRVWTRIVVNGPGPGGRHYHTMTLVGSKLFVFGGRTAKRSFNDIWALDLSCCTFSPCLSEPF